MNVSCNENLGHAIVQVVCSWLVAIGPNVQSQGSSRAFCTGEEAVQLCSFFRGLWCSPFGYISINESFAYLVI
jgi:hypothetical protein